MYKLRPIFQLPETLSVKNHLYKMKPISEALNGQKSPGNNEVQPGSGSHAQQAAGNQTEPQDIPTDVLELEKRWKAIEERLSTLQSEISRKTSCSAATDGPTNAEPLRSGPDYLVALSAQQETILNRISDLMGALSLLKSRLSFTDPSQKSCSLNELQGVQQSLLQRIIELNAEIKLLSAALNNNNVTPAQVGGFQDLVITANPSRPPHSLQIIQRLLQQSGVKVYASTHVHSSVSNLPGDLMNFLASPPSLQRSSSHLALTLIWKNSENDEAALVISPSSQSSAICGESNIARYISRVVPSLSLGSSHPDELLDLTDYGAALGVGGTKRERPAALQALEKKLASAMLSGTAHVGLVDGVVYSAVVNAKVDQQKEVGKNVTNWMERCRSFISQNNLNAPTTSSATPATLQHMTRPQLEDLLRSLDIKYSVLEHPEVYTVAAMLEHVLVLPGFHTKNLFVRDKKKGTLYLFTARHDLPVNLNQLAKLLGSKELRFAEEKVLYEKLGVKQGCVTPFALVNDKKHEVVFAVDEELIKSDETILNCHPLSNAATANLSAKDFKKFLGRTGHQYVAVRLS